MVTTMAMGMAMAMAMEMAMDMAMARLQTMNLSRKMLTETTSYKKIALVLHCKGKNADGKRSNKMAAMNDQNS